MIVDREDGDLVCPNCARRIMKKPDTPKPIPTLESVVIRASLLDQLREWPGRINGIVDRAVELYLTPKLAAGASRRERIPGHERTSARIGRKSYNRLDEFADNHSVPISAVLEELLTKFFESEKRGDDPPQRQLQVMIPPDLHTRLKRGARASQKYLNIYVTELLTAALEEPAEPVVESVEPVEPEPVAEPVIEPVIEPVVEPIVEPVVEPVESVESVEPVEPVLIIGDVVHVHIH